MTEDEAKTKWCPFARVVVQGVTKDIQPHNRVVFQRQVEAHLSPPDARCIGSACMAWRWADRESDYEYAVTDNKTFSGGFQLTPPPGDGWNDMRGMATFSVPEQFQAIENNQTAWRRKIGKSGYCGLAGESIGARGGAA